MRSFHVIFHVICFFSTNAGARENNWLRKFGNFSGKLLWQSFFSNVTNLQYSDCNFAIERTQHRFILEYVPKTSCLKKNKKRKRLWWTSVLIKLLSCSTKFAVLAKKQSSCKTFCRSVESSNIFTGKPGWSLFFTKVASLKSILRISVKRTPSQRFSYVRSAQ